MIEAAGYYAVNYANSWRLFGSSLLQKYGLWPANYRENADTVILLAAAASDSIGTKAGSTASAVM